MSAGVSPDCADARGGVFNNDSSSTWVNGLEEFLGLDTDLGYSGEGQYGMYEKIRDNKIKIRN